MQSCWFSFRRRIWRETRDEDVDIYCVWAIHSCTDRYSYTEAPYHISYGIRHAVMADCQHCYNLPSIWQLFLAYPEEKFSIWINYNSFTRLILIDLYEVLASRYYNDNSTKEYNLTFCAILKSTLCIISLRSSVQYVCCRLWKKDLECVNFRQVYQGIQLHTFRHKYPKSLHLTAYTSVYFTIQSNKWPYNIEEYVCTCLYRSELIALNSVTLTLST